MSIKIILARRVHPEKAEALRPLLLKLRSLAMDQAGYVSGETLINVNDPQEVLVISTWGTLDQWNHWLADERRREVQAKIDELLGYETVYQAYYYG